MDNSDVWSQLGKALTYLIIAGIAAFIYSIGKKGLGKSQEQSFGPSVMVYNDKETHKELALRATGGVAIILMIAFIAAFVFLGTSSDCSDADPLYGGCETTQDYIPTGKDRLGTFAFYSAFLGGAYLAGISTKYSIIKDRPRQERIAKLNKEQEKRLKG